MGGPPGSSVGRREDEDLRRNDGALEIVTPDCLEVVLEAGVDLSDVCLVTSAISENCALKV